MLFIFSFVALISYEDVEVNCYLNFIIKVVSNIDHFYLHLKKKKRTKHLMKEISQIDCLTTKKKLLKFSR